VNAVVFAGHTLFNYGVGRTDFPGGDYNQMAMSVVIILSGAANLKNEAEGRPPLSVISSYIMTRNGLTVQYGL